MTNYPRSFPTETSRKCSWYVLLLCRLLLFHGYDCAKEHDHMQSYLLANYSNKIIPGLLRNNVTAVLIQASIININDFDELSGELSIAMVFRLTWTDHRLRWNRSEFGMMYSTLFENQDVWSPQIFIMQPFDKVIRIGHSELMRVIHTGEVLSVSATVFKLSCSVNVGYFPFDEQSCFMSLSGWYYDRREVRLNSTTLILDREYYTENGQWELLDSPITHCVIGDFDNGPNIVNIEVVLKRQSEFYIVYLVVPIVFLGLMNVLVFLLPPFSEGRTSVAVTMFLSFSIFMSSLNSIVPASSSPIAMLYYYFLFLMVYSSTIIFLCILSLRMYDRDGTVPFVVRLIVYVLGFSWLKRILLQNKAVSTSADGSETQTVDTDQGTHRLKTITWKDTGRVFDRYCFWLLLSAYVGITYFAVVSITSGKVIHKETMDNVTCY